ncbi:MAG: hypothetical protein ACI4XL_11370 [Bacillus sp. (in: firmicutes)]
MKDMTSLICLFIFTLILWNISGFGHSSGTQYKYKKSYHGLRIQIEDIYLSEDIDNEKVTVNIPIRLMNKSEKGYVFHSIAISCNGKQSSDQDAIMDGNIAGKLSGYHKKEDVVSMVLDVGDVSEIRTITYAFAIYDNTLDESRVFEYKKDFSYR